MLQCFGCVVKLHFSVLRMELGLFCGAPERILVLMILQNQFDSIDISDNGIVKLDGFPKLKRLSALHVNNNRIARIGAALDGTICIV